MEGLTFLTLMTLCMTGTNDLCNDGFWKEKIQYDFPGIIGSDVNDQYNYYLRLNGFVNDLKSHFQPVNDFGYFYLLDKYPLELSAVTDSMICSLDTVMCCDTEYKLEPAFYLDKLDKLKADAHPDLYIFLPRIGGVSFDKMLDRLDLSTHGYKIMSKCEADEMLAILKRSKYFSNGTYSTMTGRGAKDAIYLGLAKLL